MRGVALAGAVWEVLRLLIGVLLVAAGTGVTVFVGDPRAALIVVLAASGLPGLAVLLAGALFSGPGTARSHGLTRPVAAGWIAGRTGALTADLLALLTMGLTGFDVDLRLRLPAVALPLTGVVLVVAALDTVVLLAILWASRRRPVRDEAVVGDRTAGVDMNAPGRATTQTDEDQAAGGSSSREILPDFVATEVQDVDLGDRDDRPIG